MLQGVAVCCSLLQSGKTLCMSHVTHIIDISVSCHSSTGFGISDKVRSGKGYI